MQRMAPGDVPSGVVEPSPYIPGAQGLAFNDASGNNVALVTRIINANQSRAFMSSRRPGRLSAPC